MAKASPAEVQKFLGGANYPASRDDLVSHATEQGASEDVIDTLQNLPDKEYASPAEVTAEIGEVEKV